MRLDAVAVLVKNQIEALVAHGVAPEEAAAEAEVRVHSVLEEMAALGLHDTYIGVALRRARVYQLRSEGAPVVAIMARLGIHREQVRLDYKEEMLRRRFHGANAQT